MIDLPFYLQIDWILGKMLLVIVLCYFIFSILVLRQIRLLVSNIRTNMTRAIYLVGFFNLLFAFLVLVASVALSF